MNVFRGVIIAMLIQLNVIIWTVVVVRAVRLLSEV